MCLREVRVFIFYQLKGWPDNRVDIKVWAPSVARGGGALLCRSRMIHGALMSTEWFKYLQRTILCVLNKYAYFKSHIVLNAYLYDNRPSVGPWLSKGTSD